MAIRGDTAPIKPSSSLYFSRLPTTFYATTELSPTLHRLSRQLQRTVLDFNNVALYTETILFQPSGFHRRPFSVQPTYKHRMFELTRPQAMNGSNIRNMKWTDAHDDVLLRIMLEMRKEGKVIPGGFTSEGWGLITREMQTKLGPQFSKDKLKNRMKSFKKWYSAMKAMLNLSGFGWDEERKKVTAEDGVWDDYIKKLDVAVVDNGAKPEAAAKHTAAMIKT